MNELIRIESRELSGATIQTCNARDLWAFVESKQEFANWIKSRIEKYGFIEDEDFTVDKFINGRATVIDYHLTIETAKELAMVENNEKGRQVRRYFIECERKAKGAIFQMPQTLSEALLLAGKLAAEKEAAELERDHAIITKAEIGSRREATAMNTASRASKKANQLEAELDRGKQYCTVKRMQMIHHGQQFNWRLLKSTGIEMGIDPIDVFDANYGTVKAYHVDVWRETYAIDLQNAV